jgi:hypothetical protein
MPANRVRMSKSLARRRIVQQFAKRRQEVVAFQTWQRHAGDRAAGRCPGLLAKR